MSCRQRLTTRSSRTSTPSSGSMRSCPRAGGRSSTGAGATSTSSRDRSGTAPSVGPPQRSCASATAGRSERCRTSPSSTGCSAARVPNRPSCRATCSSTPISSSGSSGWAARTARWRGGVAGSATGCRRAAPSTPSAQRELGAPLGLAARTEDAQLVLCDTDVVDRGLAADHQAEVVELPQFVAIGAPPVTGGVPGLVLKAHRNAVAFEGPEVLAEGVIQLARPLAGQESNDVEAADEELVAVSPYGILAVGHGDALGIGGVPGVLGGLDLLGGAIRGERWKRGTALGHGNPFASGPSRLRNRNLPDARAGGARRHGHVDPHVARID